MDWRISDAIIPGLLAVIGVVLIGVWIGGSDTGPWEPRVPGMDRVEGVQDEAEDRTAPVPNEPVAGSGKPSQLPGEWPWFRGPNLDAISDEPVKLNRNWPESGPPELWSVSMGEGYAGAAISNGCAYVLDYDEATEADTIRCLSLDDGQEIWRNSYPVEVSASHGMSRTTPAVVDGRVITIGPRCHVACWDAMTGECLWLIDLELQYGTETPRWYTGQCPFVDQGRLILAPAGRTLVMAVDIETGNPIWQTPNPLGWKMTHASIVPMDVGDVRCYIYCASAGVVGVSADDGAILWQTNQWFDKVATAPCPVVLPEGRVFFCSGYGTEVGSMMLQVQPGPGQFSATPLFTLKPRQFNSEQQTPIFYDGHLFGSRKASHGRLVCIDLEGNEKWNSGKDRFGHGPFMIADGAILAMTNNGRLVMAEASPKEYVPLASSEVFEDGHDAWGPMALVGGRLILRDMTRMKCLDLSKGATGGE